MKGFSAVGLVWLALVVLKALNHIAWSWLVVLTFPVWISIVLLIAVLTVVVAFVILLAILILLAYVFGIGD